MFPANFLTTDRISRGSEAASNKRVLEELGGLLADSAEGLEKDRVFDKLLERERLGSTGLGQGIALPHARIKGVEDARGAFVQLQSAIDFDAIDDQPVDLVFGLLVPEEATQEHLDLLAKLAMLFSDADFCDSLRKTESREAALAQIMSKQKDPGT